MKAKYLSLLVAFVASLFALPCAAQTRAPIVLPTTTFPDALVQMALYYRQSIGLELVDDDESAGVTVRPKLDLDALRFEDAIAAITASAPHGGISAWIVKHPDGQAVQGEATLEIIGMSGWWLKYPGLPPNPVLNTSPWAFPAHPSPFPAPR